MRATVGIAVALLALAADATAATKLCLKTSPTIVDVPQHARFVVRHADLARLRRSPSHVERIDEYWAAVTFDAPVGTQITEWPIVGGGCKGRSYRVVAHAPRRTTTPAIVTAEVWTSEHSSHLELGWLPPRDVGWTRVDWAYTEAELASGLHGSHHEYFDDREATLQLDPGWQIVFVRVVRFHADGSQSTWHGWVERTGSERARVGHGRPPHAGAAAPACARATARTVPLDPEFVVDGGTPRFIALTPLGAALPLQLDASERGPIAVRVAADEGTVFRLQRLPLSRTCDGVRWLEATADRARDEAPVVIRGDNGACRAAVALADPDTWPRLEVTTPTGTLAGELASEVTVTPLEHYTNARRAVTITPIWPHGVRGTPWTGWVQAEPRCAGLVVTTERPLPPEPQPPVVVAAEPPRDSLPWAPFAVLLLALAGHRRAALCALR